MATALTPDALPAAPAPPEDGHEPSWVCGLTKTQAEDLLDWLEKHGCDGCEVSYRSGRLFFVRLTRP